MYMYIYIYIIYIYVYMMQPIPIFVESMQVPAQGPLQGQLKSRQWPMKRRQWPMKSQLKGTTSATPTPTVHPVPLDATAPAAPAPLDCCLLLTSHIRDVLVYICHTCDRWLYNKEDSLLHIHITYRMCIEEDNLLHVVNCRK